MFVDLATAPPSNAYLEEADLTAPETYFPLRVLVCTSCWLVQTEDHAQANELFSKSYPYFSGVSSTWLAHTRVYVEAMIARFELGPESLVAEVAANDGSLLRFVRERAIPCYGIEPARLPAQAARERHIDIVEQFFSEALAERLVKDRGRSDLIVANNVLAHVPDINDFVQGFTILLKPEGVATFEFPHLTKLIAGCAFDTIYHEHFSYLSLGTVIRILADHGLEIFDVQELPTHGGSLRVFAQIKASRRQPVSAAVETLLDQEKLAGAGTLPYYCGFQAEADRVKDAFLSYLLDAKTRGLRMAGYGAAAKGNTLLNYAGVHADLLPYVVDRAPAKFGKHLPGSRIPIVDEDRLKRDRPHRVIILAWNLKDEVMQQLAYIRDWGGQFVCAVPTLTEE